MLFLLRLSFAWRLSFLTTSPEVIQYAMSKKLIDHSVRDGDKCSSNANTIANYLEDQVGQLKLLLSVVLHTGRIIYKRDNG